MTVYISFTIHMQQVFAESTDLNKKQITQIKQHGEIIRPSHEKMGKNTLKIFFVCPFDPFFFSFDC